MEAAEILLIEDNLGDIELTRQSFGQWRLHNNLSVVNDGLIAMSYLRREGAFASVPRPDLILLDLSLPHKDGGEVLAEIKNDPDLKRIPVVVLSTSDDEQDIVRTYDLHANCFITKPLDFDRLNEIVRSIEYFWFRIVKLPPRDA